MSKFLVQVNHIPKVREYTIDSNELSKLIHALPVKWRNVDLDDYYYYFTDWEGWAKIIEYLKPNRPRYLADKFDCDNMAKWHSIEVARLFQLNTCAEVEGWADVGRGVPERHKWNIFFDGDVFYQIEPQSGVIMEIDDPLYKPDDITIG